jgi:hypothetical protein
MFAIGSTTITFSPGSERRSAWSWATWSLVLHASVDSPFTFTPHEPQIAARHEQRTASDPSWRSRAWSRPSSTDSVSSSSTSNSCQ